MHHHLVCRALSHPACSATVRGAAAGANTGILSACRHPVASAPAIEAVLLPRIDRTANCRCSRGNVQREKVDQEEPWQRLSGKTANGCCLLLACAGWAQEEPAGPVERFFEKLYIPVPSLPYICSKLGKQVLKPQVMSKQVGGLRIYALFLALLLLAVAIQGLAIA